MRQSYASSSISRERFGRSLGLFQPSHTRSKNKVYRETGILIGKQAFSPEVSGRRLSGPKFKISFFRPLFNVDADASLGCAAEESTAIRTRSAPRTSLGSTQLDPRCFPSIGPPRNPLREADPKGSQRDGARGVTRDRRGAGERELAQTAENRKNPPTPAQNPKFSNHSQKSRRPKPRARMPISR